MASTGSSFEDFSEILLSSVKGFAVRSKRGRAVVSVAGAGPIEHDYDLLVHNTSEIFPELGNYILVECKDTGDPVGYPAIARFLHTIHSRKCKSGIIIAKHGVVRGRFNTTLIRAFDQDGTAVIVIEEKELDALVNGSMGLPSLIRKKYEALRFGLSNK